MHGLLGGYLRRQNLQNSSECGKFQKNSWRQKTDALLEALNIQKAGFPNDMRSVNSKIEKSLRKQKLNVQQARRFIWLKLTGVPPVDFFIAYSRDEFANNNLYNVTTFQRQNWGDFTRGRYVEFSKGGGDKVSGGSYTGWGWV